MSLGVLRISRLPSSQNRWLSFGLRAGAHCVLQVFPALGKIFVSQVTRSHFPTGFLRISWLPGLSVSSPLHQGGLCRAEKHPCVEDPLGAWPGCGNQSTWKRRRFLE